MCVIPDRGCACGVVGCIFPGAVTPGRVVSWLAEVVWEGPPKRVRVPYVKTRSCA